MQVSRARTPSIYMKIPSAKLLREHQLDEVKHLVVRKLLSEQLASMCNIFFSEYLAL